MLSDGNATWTDEEHAGTLNSFAMFFGDVMSIDEATTRLAPVSQRRTA
jgi:ureidoacrylate peracid hydrolase